MTFHRDDRVTLHHGDALDVLRALPDASVDSVVTDPPYGISFMGKEWDRPGVATRAATTAGDRAENPYGRSRAEIGAYGKNAAVASRAFGAWCEQWATECLRVLKPGGHLLAFGGTRTWHRLACAVEDAGFEVRDSIAWLYGSGFPKSLDVSKAIDKAAGAEREVVGQHPSPAGNKPGGASLNLSVVGMPETAEITAPATDAAREWAGWGTALKPAFEPVVVARKPLTGTVAHNVTTHGTGALNIDGCRIDVDEADRLRSATYVGSNPGTAGQTMGDGWANQGESVPMWSGKGRWPANVVLDEDMAGVLDEQSGSSKSPTGPVKQGGTVCYDVASGGRERNGEGIGYGDSGGASRFFYVAKASKRERPVVDGVAHPTVKPLALMRWLVRLVTPPGGTVLEPFAGSGTTVEACILEGFHCIAIEKGEEYLPLILERVRRQTEPIEPVRRVDVAKAIAEQVAEQLDIFGEETA